VAKNEPCSTCGGSGQLTVTCVGCNGMGCQRCGGSGHTQTTCRNCGGSGKR
jgi:hypothetical protein